MKPSPQFIAYLIGIGLFGLFYGQVKNLLGGGGVFLAAAVVYALALRLLGYLIASSFWRRPPR